MKYLFRYVLLITAFEEYGALDKFRSEADRAQENLAKEGLVVKGIQLQIGACFDSVDLPLWCGTVAHKNG